MTQEQKKGYKQTNKQTLKRKRRLTLKHLLLTDAHVALISVIAVFWFSSHHGSVFRCFSDSLYFWGFTGNNYLTSATKHRKVKRFMRGRKRELSYFSKESSQKRSTGTPPTGLIVTIQMQTF